MGRAAALALVSAMLAAAPASALESLPKVGSIGAQMLAVYLRGAEELIAAAVELGDVEELKQQYRTTLFAYLPATKVATGTNEIYCISAGSALAGFAGTMSEPPLTARKLVSARLNYRTYLSDMAKCEAATGAKRQRKLKPV